MADQPMTDQPTPEEDLFPSGPDDPSAPNGSTGSDLLAAPSTAGATGTRQNQGQSLTKHVHKATGYTWQKDEDAPGYAWRNKKAQEEMARALDGIVDKDKAIRRKYGDILAENPRQS